MTKTHSQYEELEPEYLDVVAGGATRVLSRDSQIGIPFVRPSSHHWETRSDPFPPGTTREQANDLVNRYNAPTLDALMGHGNNPNAERGVVHGPGMIPAGFIDVAHHTSKDGYGEAVNTTAFPHVFHGTTTRSVIDSPEGYRVETVGDGQGHIPVFDDIRHGVNSAAGPEAFGRLDDAMMREAASRLHGAQDSEPHVSESHAHGPIGSESYARAQGNEPHASEPHAGEPQASEQHASEPQASEPHASEPHASEPQASEPHASEPHASEPHVSEPHAGEPQAGEQHASESPATESPATEPHAGEPQASEPSHASEQQASEQQASEQQASESQASEPQASEPQASEPSQASEPHASESPSTESHASESPGSESPGSESSGSESSGSESSGSESSGSESSGSSSQGSDSQGGDGGW